MLEMWMRRAAAIGGCVSLLATGCKSDAPAHKATATVAAPIAESEPEVLGPEAEGAAFLVKLSPLEDLVVGQPSQVRLEMEAKPPFHVNQEYPYKFTLDASAQLRAAQPVVSKEQFELAESMASANIEVTPLQPGIHTLGGLFAFSVCTDDKCLIERRKLALELSASEAQ